MQLRIVAAPAEMAPPSLRPSPPLLLLMNRQLSMRAAPQCIAPPLPPPALPAPLSKNAQPSIVATSQRTPPPEGLARLFRKEQLMIVGSEPPIASNPPPPIRDKSNPFRRVS